VFQFGARRGERRYMIQGGGKTGSSSGVIGLGDVSGLGRSEVFLVSIFGLVLASLRISMGL
jgi:hypothetical protein